MTVGASTSPESPGIAPGHEPPVTPLGYFRSRPKLFLAVLGSALALGVLASVDGGRILDSVDEPITDWLVDQRTESSTSFFDWASTLGDNIVVFSLAAITAVLVFRRCRFLALAVVGAVAFRPALEFVLKALIDRERPDTGLGVFNGPSHPSGHPMAAISFYGLIPGVASLYLRSKRLWIAITVIALAVPVFVAAARVYKTAHYTTDVIASLLWGTLYLIAVHGTFERLHPPDCGSR